MVTLVENKTTAKYIGLSTDTKPMQVSDSIGMPNGSRFLEMDTGKKYYWSTNNQQWGEMPSSGGGGGSSSGDGAFWVNVAVGQRWRDSTADKTLAEIQSAFDDGMSVWAKLTISDADYTIVVPLMGIGDGFASFGASNFSDGYLTSIGAMITTSSCEAYRDSYNTKEGQLITVGLVQNDGEWYTPNYSISEIIGLIQTGAMSVILQDTSSGLVYQLNELQDDGSGIAFSAMKFSGDAVPTPEFWRMTGYPANNKKWICNQNQG